VSSKNKGNKNKKSVSTVPQTESAPTAKKTDIPVVPPAPQPDFFSMLGKNAQYLCLGIVLLIAFFVYHEYLMMSKVFYFKDIGSDSYNYNYPCIYHLTGYIAKYGLPKWSFTYGMGQNSLPFFLRDPFDILLILLGREHLHYTTIFKEILKILLSGWVFFSYLKTLRLSNFTAIVGALLFSFCGFMVVGGGWYLFSFETFNFALLLLGVELLFANRKFWVFTFAIALICLSQPFNLYVYGLFMFFYVLFRLLQQEKRDIGTMLAFIGKLAGLGVLAMLITAPFLAENIIQLLESPRGSGTNSYAKILSSQPMFDFPQPELFGTCMLRLFSSDMLGTGNDFKGWMNFLEAPMLYCGLPCLVLMPQVFQFLDKRKRIIFAIFFALWILPLVFPYFRYAFWLFTGDYFRAYSIFVAFVLLYYAIIALDFIVAQQKVNWIVLLGTVILLYVLLNYPYFTENNINTGVSVFVSVFIILYAVLLFLVGRKFNIALLQYGFLFLVAVELIYLSGKSVNDRNPITASELQDRSGYNDNTIEAVKYLKQADKSFFRIDKTYTSTPAMHGSLNDGMVQDYYGTTEYNPFNQVYYIYYLQLMGISDKRDELQSRWAQGLSNHPILESENRVKYFLAKDRINPLWAAIADTVGTQGNVKIFRNKFLLPFGYTYSAYIRESVFEGLPSLQKEFLSLQTAVVKDADVDKFAGLKEFQLKDTLPPNGFNFDIYRRMTDELAKDSLSLSQIGETDIKGSISLAANKILYLPVPYDGGWHLTVDGKPTNKLILFAGMTGVMLPAGNHQVAMHYELRYFYTGLIASFIGFVILGVLFWWEYKKKAAAKNGGN
jgi:uncharacterized membrane protein YfhO